jgi:hypothetical protein
MFEKFLQKDEKILKHLIEYKTNNKLLKIVEYFEFETFIEINLRYFKKMTWIRKRFRK